MNSNSNRVDHLQQKHPGGTSIRTKMKIFVSLNNFLLIVLENISQYLSNQYLLVYFTTTPGNCRRRLCPSGN